MSEPLPLADKLDAATLAELLHALRRRWWMALLILALGLALTVALRPGSVEKFTSTAVVRIDAADIMAQQHFNSAADFSIWAMAVCINSSPLQIGGEVKLPDSYHPTVQGDLVYLTVTDTTAAAAQQKANAWARAACGLITLAQIKAPAEEHTLTEAVKPTRFLIMGVAASLFFALFVPIALELFNTTVTPNLLPREFPSVALPLSPTPSPLSGARGDALHALYVSLQLELRKLGPEQPRVVAITSAARGAGASTLCGQLASLAKSLGENVLAVDADPGEESLSKNANAPTGGSDWKTGMDVRGSAGAAGAPPAERGGSFFASRLDLSSAQKAAASLRSEYKLILIDTPPLASSGHAQAIVGAADLTLLVVASRRTALSALSQALATLRHNSTAPVVIVLNRVDALDLRTYFGAGA